ncbi:hypothetical protein Anapl_12103 [Anas platyrhynchos]|uniref:Uncharacterized protein n=1 Tax=Anas platyrhynchos TaxID=8839 RepID=R0L8E2_ANAPL|nr:hypothetical protein Anapl_12103 [Anas platyrhynchos]
MHSGNLGRLQLFTAFAGIIKTVSMTVINITISERIRVTAVISWTGTDGMHGHHTPIGISEMTWTTPLHTANHRRLAINLSNITDILNLTPKVTLPYTKLWSPNTSSMHPQLSACMNLADATCVLALPTANAAPEQRLRLLVTMRSHVSLPTMKERQPSQEGSGDNADAGEQALAVPQPWKPAKTIWLLDCAIKIREMFDEILETSEEVELYLHFHNRISLMPGASGFNANTFGNNTSLKMFFLALTQAFWEEVEGCFFTSQEQRRSKFKFLFCLIWGITCFPVFQFPGPSAALPHVAEGNRWVIIMRKKANGGHAEGKCSSVASCPGNTKPPLVIHCTHTANQSVTTKSTLPKSLNCTVTFLKFKSKSGAMGDRLHESIPSVSQSTRSTLRAPHWPRSTRFKAPAGSARAAKAHVAAWRSRGDTVFPLSHVPLMICRWAELLASVVLRGVPQRRKTIQMGFNLQHCTDCPFKIIIPEHRLQKLFPQCVCLLGITVFLFYSSTETLESGHTEQFSSKHSGLAASIPIEAKKLIQLNERPDEHQSQPKRRMRDWLAKRGAGKKEHDLPLRRVKSPQLHP